MKSEFDPVTKTKIDRFLTCLAELPSDACTYVIDSIFSECLLKLRSENAMAEEIANVLKADCTLVLILKDGRWHLESGHVYSAPAAYVEIIDSVSDAIKAVVAPSTPEESGSIH